MSIEAIGRGFGGGVLKTKMTDSQESSFISLAGLWNKLYRLQLFRRTKTYLYYFMVNFKLESGDIYIYMCVCVCVCLCVCVCVCVCVCLKGHTFRCTLLNKQSQKVICS